MWHEWSTLRKLIFLKVVLGGAETKTVSGTSPLSLVNAVAHSILSLVQIGKSEQASTPTPSAPVAVKCNNGALQLVDDELPAGYRRVLGYECDNDSMWEITDFHLKGSDTVRISFEIAAACNVFGCYQGTDATDNYDLYVSTSANAKYFRYGGGTYLSTWSATDLGKRFDVVYTPYGSQGMPQDSTWSPLTFTSANDLLIGATTLTGSSAKLKGKLYGNFEVDGRLKLIPCERVSDNVLGYYDTVGETFYGPYSGYDGAVSLGYDGSHYSLQTVGTPEVITVIPGGAWDATDNAIAQGTIASADGKDGGASTSRLRTTGYMAVKPSTQYTISTNLAALYIFQYDADQTYLGSSVATGWVRSPHTFITNANAHYIRFTLAKAYPATSASVSPSDMEYVQVVEGASVITQTASAQDLYAVGSSADTQEIISGAVTRKVGVKVITGDENFGSSSTYGQAYYISGAAGAWGAEKALVACTHFEGKATASSANPDGTCFFNASGHFYFRTDSFSGAAAFKTWVKEQYDKGEPVIVYFQRATEGSDQVAEQPLSAAKGTNTITVTAEVSGIQLSAEYKGKS